MNRYIILFTIVVHFTGAVIALGQELLVVGGNDPQQAAAAPVTELTVTAAPAPEPALRYELLPGVLEEKSSNAALQYYQAIIQMQRGGAAQYDDLLSTPREEWPKDIDAALLSQKLVTLLARQAALRTDCDFGYMTREEGISALLVGLSEFRQLGRVVALHARDAAAAGRTVEAIEHLQTLIAMARHQADSQTLIQALVGIGTANEALNQLEAVIERGDAPNFYWALSTLPQPLIDLRPILRQERQFVYLEYPELAAATEARTPEQRRAVAAAMAKLQQQWADGIEASRTDAAEGRVREAVVAMSVYPRAKQWLITHGVAAKEAEAMPVTDALALYSVAQYEHWRDEINKFQGLPFHEAHPRMRQAEREFDSASSEALAMASHLPSVSRALFVGARLDRRIAMLRVVEALRMHAAQHGSLPGALDQVTIVPIPLDPMTNQPFGYRVEGNTFVLTAAPPPDHRPNDGMIYRVILRPPGTPENKE